MVASPVAVRVTHKFHCGWISALDSQLDIRILRSQQISCHSPQRFQRSSGGSSQIRSKDAQLDPTRNTSVRQHMIDTDKCHQLSPAIFARCVNTPGVGRAFAPVSPNWFATDSRYFALGCVRVSSVIGIRSRLKCSYGFTNYSHP